MTIHPAMCVSAQRCFEPMAVSREFNMITWLTCPALGLQKRKCEHPPARAGSETF